MFRSFDDKAGSEAFSVPIEAAPPFGREMFEKTYLNFSDFTL